MQFMPATWAEYGVDGDGDGVKDPVNKWDAIFAAANYLKASGAPGNWHDAIFAYNHAEWYVDEVLGYSNQYFPYLQPRGGTGASCSGELETGPANIQEAITLTEPRKWVPMPPDIGDADEVIDARIVNAARWITQTYHLHITQGGWQPGSPSVSHGWGTALDMVPTGNYYNSQRVYLGQRYIDLAFTRYHQHRFDRSRLAEYLNLKPKGLPTFAERFTGGVR